MRVLLWLRYNGSPFGGWQAQTNTHSVQRTVEKWLSQLYNTHVSIVGSSRTDRGVHARGQIASCDLPSDAFDLGILQYKLNRLLAPHIFVSRITEVAPQFRIHQEVASKIYHYCLYSNPSLRPFYHPWAHGVSKAQSTPDTLNPYLAVYQGTHDFRNFANTGSKVLTTTRTILHIRARRHGALTIIRIHASGFLKQMARNMVGAVLASICYGKNPKDLATMLTDSKRSPLIVPAPAHALTLMHIRLRF